MKRFLITLAGAIAILVAAIGLTLRFVDFGPYMDPALGQLGIALGRELAVDGDLEIRLLPRPRLIAHDVRLANADWGSAPDMARIRRLEIEIGLLPLLSRQLRLTRISLLEPQLLLERRADGTGNWELTPLQSRADPEQGQDTLLHVIDIGQILLANGQFVYVDGPSGERYELRLARLGYQPTPEGARFRIEGEFRGIEARATLDTLPITALTSAPTIPVTLQAAADDVALTAAGHLHRPQADGLLDLQIHLRAPDARLLATLLDEQLPPTGAIDIRARIRNTEPGVQVSDLLAVVGDSDIKGDIAVALQGKRPRVTAHLRSKSLDLASLTGGGRDAGGQAAPPGPAAQPPTAGRLIPDEPLPLAWLQQIDLTADLAIARLQLPRTTLHDANTRFELRDGRLRVEPAAARFPGGGQVTMRLEIDGTASPPRLRSDFRARQFRLGEFETFRDIVQGTKTTVNMQLTGHGDSPATLAASLNGSIEITAEEGKILNSNLDLLGSNLALDLVHAINPFSTREATSRLRCAVVRFEIKEGIATADRSIALETDKINMLSSGYIDLRKEMLEFNFRPEARALLSVDLGELAKLVRLAGPLSDPVIEIDPVGTARLGVTVGAAVATAGTSYLVQRLWATTLGGAPACEVALGRVKPATATDTTTQVIGKPVKAVGTGVKRGAGAVGGGLRKIGSGVGKLLGLGGTKDDQPPQPEEEEDE